MQTQNEQNNHQPEAVSLFEVIASKEGGKAYPFGMTFTDPETAAAYANRMTDLGYSAEVSPQFETEPDLKAALENARRHFEDTDIKPE